MRAMTTPADSLWQLLDRARVGALAVHEAGHPAVSQVPFVTLRGPARVFALVSELSSHTAALRADPRCGFLVSDPPMVDDPRSNHALTRLSLKCTAEFVSRDEALALGVTERYRARYPIADTLLGLKDFHFVALRPIADGGTFIQGFGRAYSVSGDDLDALTHARG